MLRYAVATGRAERDATADHPARARLLETRKIITEAWMKVADSLDAQNEAILAGEVRQFVEHMPRVMTNKERLAERFIRMLASQQSAEARVEHGRGEERIR